MIYKIKKDDIELEIDELTYLSDQPEQIQSFISEHKEIDIVECDNAIIQLFHSGRILINYK